MHPAMSQLIMKWQLGPPEIEHEMSEERCIELIVEGKIHGFAECDLEVPEYLWSYFAEFSPFFQNGEVLLNDLDSVQKEIARDTYGK